MPYFESTGDASQKLHQSIVRYKGEPVFVSHRDGEFIYSMQFLLDKGRFETINVNDEIANGNLDIRAFELGYVNFTSTTPLLTRIPIRQWKAGINNNNVRAINFERARPQQDAISLSTLVSQAVGEMIINKYPSFEEAYNTCEKKAVPFHRKAVVYKDDLGITKIRYFGEPVAYINERHEVVYPETKRMQLFVLKKESQLSKFPTKEIAL